MNLSFERKDENTPYASLRIVETVTSFVKENSPSFIRCFVSVTLYQNHLILALI